MKKIILISFLLLLLTGCLYPEERRTENQVPFEDQITSVQQAVVQYRLANQALPVHTINNETDLYQRYLIDFQKLVPNYLTQVPGNSFENGGIYQYLLIDVEEDPQVKLLDLSITKEIQQFQRTINDYRRKHRFAPIKEVIQNKTFVLDEKKLNLKEAPTVKSPFHPDHRLPLLMDGNGNVIVDYTIDLIYAINKFEHNFQNGEDIRKILVNNYHFVPAYSVSYTVEAGKVVFVE